MQLRLEDEDTAFEERQGKGKLQPEFLIISEKAVQLQGIVQTQTGQVRADPHC